jgi:hypothetical protein
MSMLVDLVPKLWLIMNMGENVKRMMVWKENIDVLQWKVYSTILLLVGLDGSFHGTLLLARV